MVTRTRNSTTESNKTTAAKAADTAARPAGRRRATLKVTAADTTPAERQQLIAEAAYYIAESRGFSPGNELEDWLQAEQGVDLLTGGSMH